MKILFLGPMAGTSHQRADAMRRLGHQVRAINPQSFVPRQRLVAKFHYETGGVFSDGRVTAGILDALGDERFDLVWVDHGRYVGPHLIQSLRRRSGPVVSFNNDDPYGRRDRGSWLLYRTAIPAYDLVVVCRHENVAEAYARGAKSVLHLFRCADEVAHAPRPLTTEERDRWKSDVLFVGTWMPERGPFLYELLQRGVPLTLYGVRWQKAREWPALRNVWKGPGLYDDDDYARAIQCAKICLGLLSKGNRDHHTTRSLEIPSLGSVLCAERTDEHLQLYCDGQEAIFWSDVAECADICLELLADEPRRQEIARAGHLRCLENGHFNERMLRQVFSAVESSVPR